MLHKHNKSYMDIYKANMHGICCYAFNIVFIYSLHSDIDWTAANQQL